MPLRPTHAFSIVARDSATGALGGAIVSPLFAAGRDVLWIRQEVGAVANQGFIHVAGGSGTLERLAAGKSPKDALAELIAADPGSALRQIGVVAASGASAAHTGERCVAQAVHHHGQNFSVQANMMDKSSVVPAMVAAWESSEGTELAERLVAVLRAGQAASGEGPAVQSAAVIVAPPKASGSGWERYQVDLRVDEHTDPIEEIGRLLAVHRGYQHLDEAEIALEREDLPAAIRHYETASELVPENTEIQFWHGLLLIQNGDALPGAAKLRMVCTRQPRWIEVARRLGDVNIISQETVAQVLTIVSP
ncbi:MAG: DUF1028 domain-containing protein [Proteobacteria bacterium]|nr:DUF1028 domain-containing protein [Pseudomonadota bacterium]